MYRFFNVASSFAILALVIMSVLNRFGWIPKSASGLQATVSVALGAVLLAAAVALIWRVYFVNARSVEAANIDESATPEREFDFRGQKFFGGFVMMLGGGLAFPTLVIWPCLLAVNTKLAGNGAILFAVGLFFCCGAFLFMIGRRYWYARATIYPDRLAVRGINSNGSMKWSEATGFFHEELSNVGNNTMWVYFLCSEVRSLRIEATVKEPEEFVRMVRAKTGLRLQECPMNPEPVPVAHKHAAFRK